ncbi:MAG: acetolactate synthase-1/2/3 large subunit, partial [Francisellaceae bacterium]
GSINENITLLKNKISIININHDEALQKELFDRINAGKALEGKNNSVHPLRLVYEINKIMDEDTIICCDIGSVYMWLARYLMSHKPHQLLFSNGQQTLGVALPWGIAIKLADPKKKIITVSGDGGFLFSAMELETAVREKIKFTHFIWRDGHYNMVQEQQLMKYKRESGVKLGKVDIPKFAEAFGAKGYYVTRPEDIVSTYNESLKSSLPALIEIEVDYSDNLQMFTEAHDPQLGN